MKGYQSSIADPFVAPLLGFGSLFAPQNFDYAQDDMFFVDFGSPFNAKQPSPSKRRRRFLDFIRGADFIHEVDFISEGDFIP